MASTLAAEIIARYDPTLESENKLLISDITSRVAQFEQMLPGTRKPSRDLTVAAFKDFCDLAAYSEDLSQRVGIDTKATVTIDGEVIPVYDFSCLSYDAMEALAQQLAAEFDAKVPDATKVFPHFTTGWSDHDWKYWIGKFLGLFGLREVSVAFFEILEGEVPALVEALALALRERNWAALRELLVLLLDFIMSKGFFRKLADKIGEVAARKIIAKMAAKLLPFVGWAVLIGQFIWAIGEEFV